MKIPKYWAKGETDTLMQRSPATGEHIGPFACWGWSDISLEDAKIHGEKRAAKFGKLFHDGNLPNGEYAYSDRPIREEILDEWFHDDKEAPYVAVTRNAYGCRVLNAASAMFVDVDLPEPSLSKILGHKIKTWLGKTDPPPHEQQEIDALSILRKLAESDTTFGVRIYRTRAGLRYLLTHLHGDPVSDTTAKIMTYLGADPLYMRLCKMQECFRARLNPKPYRCDMRRLKVRYPWQDATAKDELNVWLEEYTLKSEAFATCKFIEHLGNTAMDSTIERVVNFHDKETRATSRLSLA